MSRHIDRAEEYMGSADWVRVNGLKVKRLTFHDLLGKVAFRHCDGVVNVKKAPAADEYRTDAVSYIRHCRGVSQYVREFYMVILNIYLSPILDNHIMHLFSQTVMEHIQN